MGPSGTRLEAHTTEDHRHLLLFFLARSRTGRRNGNGLMKCTDGFYDFSWLLLSHRFSSHLLEGARRFWWWYHCCRLFLLMLAHTFCSPRLITSGSTHGNMFKQGRWGGYNDGVAEATCKIGNRKGERGLILFGGCSKWSGTAWGVKCRWHRRWTVAEMGIITHHGLSILPRG